MSDDGQPEATGDGTGTAVAFAAGVAAKTATDAEERSEAADAQAEVAADVAFSAADNAAEARETAEAAADSAEWTRTEFDEYRQTNDARFAEIGDQLARAMEALEGLRPADSADAAGGGGAPAPAPHQSSEKAPEGSTSDTGTPPKRRARADGMSAGWFGKDDDD